MHGKLHETFIHARIPYLYPLLEQKNRNHVVRVHRPNTFLTSMGNMEGNWRLLDHLVAEKPISIRESTTFKRTFPFDSESGGLYISRPDSEDEVMLQQNSGQFAGIKLMRGLWQEKPIGSCSGTYFPVAAPATGGGVMWCSAGHCLMSSLQRHWRCGYRLQVFPTSPTSELAVRAVVDQDWLKASLTRSELAETTPSHPPRPIVAAQVMPDFGFMLTLRPIVHPQQIFIPCARQLTEGESVCVLGFAHKPDANWACTFLRTEADYEQRALECQVLNHNEELPVDWQLSDREALERLSDLQEEVLFPSRLVAAPGLVVAASQRIVEHTCSTFPGMSGGPGVDVHTPWKLLFVHTRADSDWRRGNYGYSVNHPLFVKAYVREVLPKLLDTPNQLFTAEMVQCLHEYLEAHLGELDDRGVLDRVAQFMTC